MNTRNKRIFTAVAVTVFLFSLFVCRADAASPWAEKKGYGARTAGKLGFGLKNTLLGWMTPWAEAKNPKYPNTWAGYSAGVGEALVYTAGGLVQLVTFFVPVDFPDMGYGLPIPDPERVKNPHKSYAPYSKK